MSNKGNLLLVEDDEGLREVLSSDLSEICHVDTAINGLDAIEKIKLKKYDAILSDVKMPKMDGIELLKWVRSNNYKYPFIVLTGFGTHKLVLSALQLGAYNFLDKPSKQEDLFSTVLSAIEIGQQFHLWNDSEFQENSISKLIQESSDAAQISLAKALGLPTDHLSKLKTLLLKKY